MPGFENGSNYLALPRSNQRWLIQDVVPAGGWTAIHGKPKTHKSWLALDIAHAISNPSVDMWNGFPVLHHGPVLYLQVDTPREEWARRVQALADGTNALLDFSQVYIADMEMVKAYPFHVTNLTNGNWQWLCDEVARIKPVLVIFDVFREIHGVDENDSMQMQQVFALLTKALLSVRAAGFLVAHSRKETEYSRKGGDDMMEDLRGSSYIPGRMDNMIFLTKTKMAWRGRASEGEVSTMINPDSGLVVLDKKAQDEADIVTRVLVGELRSNPKVTKRDVARAICTSMGWDATNASDVKKAERKIGNRLDTMRGGHLNVPPATPTP